MSPNKKVLITGASKGIGKAIAEKLCDNGYTVIGTSRHPEKLKDVNRLSGVTYKKLDLLNQEDIGNIVNDVKNVDILINNAGASLMSPVEETSMEKIRRVFQLNVFGHIELIKGILPYMRKQQSGLIINVTSFAAHTPVPFSSVYASAKSAMETMSKALNNEVYQYGIKVICVAPVFVKTNIHQEKICDSSSSYYRSFNKVKTTRDSNIESGVNPEIIADKIFKIINKNNPRVFYAVGNNSKLMNLLCKVLPVDFILKNIRKKFQI